MKNFLLSWLSGFLIIFLFGWLIFGIFLQSFYSDFMAQLGDSVMKEPPILPIIIAQLSFALFLTIWLIKNEVKSFIEGISKSIIVTFILLVWFEAWMFSMFSQMNITIAVVDVLGNMITILLASGVMGLILGKVKSELIIKSE